MLLGKTVFRHPAKGGSTPAFAYQRAAIAPLPCPNLRACVHRRFKSVAA